MPSLQFKGKPFVQNYHLAVPFHELIPVKEKSVSDKPSLTDNLIIHGDNLKALKSLLPLYAGKVKVVFIDPPYNTGNEKWIYNDNVNSPMMQEWLGKVVDREDLTRHDKWLCMMMPRLKLIKELMSKDGIIAVAIDDNELFQVGNLMDEVFGEENELACAPWLAEPSGGKEKTGLRGGHEYILIYHNGDDSNITMEERSTGELDLKDKFGKYRKGRELRKWGGTSLRSDREGQWFALKAPDGKEVFPIRNDGKEGHWRWGKDNPRMKEILSDPERCHWEKRPFDEGVTYKGLSERWVPYAKIRDKKKSVGWSTWLDSYGFNSDATRELKEIFGSKVFDTPKPTSLVQWIASLHADENALVLDSFAGSGTTGQAVLNLNLDDDGNRKFIMVECEIDANRITAERIRRVIRGIKDAKDENLQRGLGGSFTFCDLGDPMDEQRLLAGKSLPTYEELARYAFYVSTGEEFKLEKMDKTIGFVGESTKYHVYLFYEPKADVLRNLALDLEKAEKMKPLKEGKRRLVFAPTKYLDQDYLDQYQIDFAQLPYEIYQRAK